MELKPLRCLFLAKWQPTVLIVPFMELKQNFDLGYDILNKSLNRTFYGIET